MLNAFRPYGLAAAITAASCLVAVAVAGAFDLRLRDPDGIAGPAYVRLPAVFALFVLSDVLPRSVRARRSPWRVLTERYPPDRVALAAVGFASFYGSYVAYRNLKGALPLARPNVLDDPLLRLDRAMALGLDPAQVLHDLLGTGAAAEFLSAVYLLFLVFVPLSLGAALVWGRSIRNGAWYVTALCLNWLLGIVTYYLVPSLGPAFVAPYLFSDLPRTDVARLQTYLAETRFEVAWDPAGANALAGVAGFASLHVSVVFTAALIAHRVGLPLLLRAALWSFLVLTIVATAYFGWHYVVDDIAGLLLGWIAVALADRATRDAPETARVRTRPRVPRARRLLLQR